MKKEVLNFLKDIQKDFCWLLYSREYTKKYDFDGEEAEEVCRADFPRCCDLASVLLASYLSVHVSDETKVYIMPAGHISHAWCECEGEVIDYTYFQFDLDSELIEKFKKFQWKRDEFDSYISQQKFIWTGDNKHLQCQKQFMGVSELELLSKDIAMKYTFSKEDFIKYVDESFELVELNL